MAKPTTKPPLDDSRAFILIREAVLAMQNTKGYVTLSAAQCEALLSRVPELRAYAFRA